MIHSRRGHFLLVAMIIVALVGAMLVVGGRGYQALAVRTHQAGLDAATAQLVADARAWIAGHPDRIAELEAGESITLDAGQACPPPLTHRLTIERQTDSANLRISARIASGRLASQLGITIPLPGNQP